MNMGPWSGPGGCERLSAMSASTSSRRPMTPPAAPLRSPLVTWEVRCLALLYMCTHIHMHVHIHLHRYYICRNICLLLSKQICMCIDCIDIHIAICTCTCICMCICISLKYVSTDLFLFVNAGVSVQVCLYTHAYLRTGLSDNLHMNVQMSVWMYQTYVYVSPCGHGSLPACVCF